LELVLMYKTTSGDAISSTNNALGTVIFTTNYDPLANVFTTKQAMEAYKWSSNGKPSKSFLHRVDCSASQLPVRERYVRAGAPPSGADLRFYDLGEFQTAVVGMQAATTIGELWVSYKVRLYDPTVTAITTPPPPCPPQYATHFVGEVTTSDRTNWVSNGAVEFDNTGGSCSLPSPNQLAISKGGTYQITYAANLNSASDVSTFAVIGMGSNIVPLTILANNGSPNWFAAAYITTGILVDNYIIVTMFVTITTGSGSTNLMQFRSNASPTTGTWLWDLYILEVDPAITVSKRQKIKSGKDEEKVGEQIKLVDQKEEESPVLVHETEELSDELVKTMVKPRGRQSLTIAVQKK